MHRCVKDLWYGGVWDFSTLYTMIPDEIMNLIRDIPIPSTILDDPDSWSWKENVDLKYSAKSIYLWLHDQRGTVPRDGAWHWVWRIRAPKKVHFMIWLVLQNSLPTKSLLVRRHIFTDATCPCCIDHDETILHCLRDYIFAKGVWSRLGLFEHADFLCEDVVFWLKRNVIGPNSILFLSTIWWIWRWRNNFIFSLDRWDISIVSVPPEGTAKLNVDGSFLRDSRSISTGCVLGDARGDWVYGFSCKEGNGSILEAELLVARRGLDMAWNRGITKVICESNSLEVIHLLGRDSHTLDITLSSILAKI
ncbi:Ribonuclease H-like superfamily [Sesbania bispinosa]|nr:Ribonuclease H-like superfamily [Sesbania bispinosa]